MMRLTPVVDSKARMLRPSRPMMRPLTSAAGRWTTATTVEAVLTQAADACSGGRPGARRESLEAYVKRLERIEEIAAGKPGVEKVFAMQAGREIRVMVRPDDMDDIGAAVLARDVAKQIEEELTYPGQVRVTVIRESRATEIAR